MAEREYFGFVVDLDAFSGPLDLLLSLIRRDELDVLEIPIARITDQFVAALDAMRERRIEVTGEFLVMAATLMQIKSRLLLPRPVAAAASDDDEAEDPRRELVELLLEYQRYKEAAGLLDRLAAARQQLFDVPRAGDETGPPPLGEATLTALFAAYEEVLARATPPEQPRLRETAYNVKAQVGLILARLAFGPLTFAALFGARPGRLEVAVTFMALLELVRDGLVRAEQEETCGEIRLARSDGRVSPGPDA